MKYNLNEDQVTSLLNKISNPALRNLIIMMLTGQEQEQDEKQDAASGRRTTLNKTVEDVKHLLEINKVMKIALTELKSENEKIVERYRLLTSALGACECLGENVVCPICHGKGKAGSRSINEKAFNRYVYPLIQRITQTAEEEKDDQWNKKLSKEKQDMHHSKN